MKNSPLKFVCDEQLGRLAKWLRLQGFDAVFNCPFPDKELTRLAQSEGRVILTRDRSLYSKTLWEAIVVIEEISYEKQLRELRRKVKLPAIKMFSRCLECNKPVVLIEKQKVESRIPAEIYRNYEKFYTCPSCQKIFWEGTHVKNTQHRLSHILK